MTTAAGITKTRPRILSGPLARLLMADFGAMASFYLLLSAVPLYATSVGAGGIGAGLSTGVLMFASVAAELVMPRLAARVGYRRTLAIGLIMLGAPALLLPVWSNTIAITAVSVVRGIGFAVVVVAVGALTATVVPAERRGEGLGLLAPAVVVSALGVLALVMMENTTAVVAGMVIFGVGFGVAQSASIALMMDRVDPSGYGTVSAMWNMAYDLGWGAGAATFGILAAVVGYPAAFATIAVLMSVVLPLARSVRGPARRG